MSDSHVLGCITWPGGPKVRIIDIDTQGILHMSQLSAASYS